MTTETKTLSAADKLAHVVAFLNEHDLTEQVINISLRGAVHTPSVLLHTPPQVQALGERCGESVSECSSGQSRFVDVIINGIEFTSNDCGVRNVFVSR